MLISSFPTHVLTTSHCNQTLAGCCLARPGADAEINMTVAEYPKGCGLSKFFVATPF